jgi:D-lactate dehydrogenase (cytochrome)
LASSKGHLSASSEDYLLEREAVSQCQYVLVYTAEGMSEDVRAELAQVRDLLTTLQAHSALETERIIGSQFWANVLGTRSENSIVVRTGIPVKNLSEYVQECASLIDSGNWIVDMANGFVYAMYERRSVDETARWIDALRSPALKREGYAIVMDMPVWLGMRDGAIDRWGYRPQSLHVMQRLKECWDRVGVLNPGTFVVE